MTPKFVEMQKSIDERINKMQESFNGEIAGIKDQMSSIMTLLE